MNTLTLRNPSTPALAAQASTGIDPIEARRDELLHEAIHKEKALRASADDAQKKAWALMREYGELARANAVDRATEVYAEAGRLMEESRRILNVDLKQVQAELVSIAGHSHPTLVCMRHSAELRAEAEKRSRPAPENLPSFVVLDESFGWTKNSIPTVFAAGQVVRDPELIRELIERNAPVVR